MCIYNYIANSLLYRQLEPLFGADGVREVWSQMIAFARVVIGLTLFTLIITIDIALVSADEVLLLGRVRDDLGQPLDVIHIRVQSDSKQLLERTIDLKPRGEVHISIEPVDQQQIYCYISAAGFESAKVSAIVQGRRALLGTVELKRYIELGPITTLELANGQSSYIDFWITSRTSRSLKIQQVIVTAQEPRNTSCFESAPRLAFHFERIVTAGAPNAKSKEQELAAFFKIRPESEVTPSIGFRASGTVFRDQCGSSIVKLTVPYSFALEKKDQNNPKKIRIEIPLQIEITGTGTFRPDWRNASVHLMLAEGEIISVESRRKLKH